MANTEREFEFIKQRLWRLTPEERENFEEFKDKHREYRWLTPDEVELFRVLRFVGDWPGCVCSNCGQPIYLQEVRRLKMAEEIEAAYEAVVADENRLCEDCKHPEEAEVKARRELQRLRTMPYADYLLTEHWQQLRRPVLERAGFRCQVCNSDQKLQVHHRTYERRGEESLDDLISLCENCHEIFHANSKVQS